MQIYQNIVNLITVVHVNAPSSYVCLLQWFIHVMFSNIAGSRYKMIEDVENNAVTGVGNILSIHKRYVWGEMDTRITLELTH